MCFIILIKYRKEVEAMNLYIQITHKEQGQQGSSQSVVQLSQNHESQQQRQKMHQGICSSNRRKSNTNKYHYNWNKTQNKKYISFLIKNGQMFNLSQQEKKCVKINVIMSETIKTRSPAQCHSHHQKMMIKYATIENIIRANYDLINVKMVPKKNRELLEDLSAYKRAKENVARENEATEESRQQNTIPAWHEYLNDNSFLMSSPFNDEVSYFL